jgi:hypothetical protein
MRNGTVLSLVSVALCLLLLVPAARAGGEASTEEHATAARSTHRLQSAVIGAAGAPGSSSGLRCWGTLGQPVTVTGGTSAGIAVSSGFWTAPKLRTDVPLEFSESASPAPPTALLPNFPNPFNPSTTIRYTLGEETAVTLTVFNVHGREVRTLVRGTEQAGPHEAVWDGRDNHGQDVGSGLYFYLLRAGDFRNTRKMVLLK